MRRVGGLSAATIASLLLGTSLLYANPLERRAIGVSPDVARVFEAPIGTITPLPAPIEISYRPIGRVPFQSLFHIDNIKGLFVGETLTEADGDGLRRHFRIDYMDFERNGFAAKLPITASYQVRIRRSGEYLEIGPLSVSAPDKPTDSRFSTEDWRSLREQIVPALTKMLDRSRTEDCLYQPRYPGGRIATDTAVGLKDVRELMRRLAECLIAMGTGQSWAESDDYKRQPEQFLDRMEQNLKASSMRLETDIRLRGTVRMNGAEFLVMGGPTRISAKGEQAASLLGFPVPAGVRVDSIEGQSEALSLIDPYSGAIYKTSLSGTTTAYPAAGSQSSAFITIKQRADYFGDIPRFYAAVPAPPSVAIPPTQPSAPSRPLPAPAPRVQQEPKTLVSLYRETISSVFTVRTDSSLGTAFVAGAGVLITARHVVKDAKVVDLENTSGHRFKARVLLPAADVDIAYLVPTSPQRLSPLALAADVPPIGTKLVVIGSPVGLDGTLTTGTVSQLRPFKGRLVLQFEGFVTNGNSGGPIMDLEGKVLGIVMAKLPPDVGVGLNFGVSTVDVIGEAPREARALIARN